MTQALIDSQNLARLLAGKPTLTPLTNEDWDRIYELAAKQWLIGALAVAIQKLPASQKPQIPELIACANEVLQFQAEREADIKKEITRLNKILQPYGPILWLKGADDLLQGIFSQPGERWMMDLDLLVPENNVKPAWLHLKTHQYQVQNKANLSYFDWDNEQWHDCPALVSDAKISIELHRFIGRFRSNNLMPAAALLNNSQNVNDENGNHCRVLDYESGLIHRIMHSQVFDSMEERKIINLRYLFHTYIYLEKNQDKINFFKIEKTLNQHGYGDSLKRFTHLLWFLFEFKTPLYQANCSVGNTYIKKISHGMSSSLSARLLAYFHLPSLLIKETLAPNTIVKNFGPPQNHLHWGLLYLKQFKKLFVSALSLKKWQATLKALKRFN